MMPIPDYEGEILEQDWEGLCYTGAFRWATESNERDWVLVHGTVLSERVGKRIEHAWCERDEVIVDLAMPIGARIIEREKYYGVVQPKVNNTRLTTPCYCRSRPSMMDRGTMTSK